MVTPRKLQTALKLLNSKKFIRKYSEFVPRSEPVQKKEKNDLKQFLNHYNNILVLTGAGVSTESGIPDYRSEEVGLFVKSSHKPIQYNEFLKNEAARNRYWARNFVGWPNFYKLSPNKTHYFISALQSMPGKCIGLITQNVDCLHFKAGSKDVIELHGNSYWVKCLGCNIIISRHDFQKILTENNPNFTLTGEEIRPDGDIEIDSEKAKNFVVPACQKCGGIFKPTVVFFGDNVPPKRVKKVEELVEKCDALFIIGTSLSTQSSYRIVTQAYDLNKFLCLINIGATRADHMMNLIINGKCSDAIPKIDES